MILFIVGFCGGMGLMWAIREAELAKAMDLVHSSAVGLPHGARHSSTEGQAGGIGGGDG